MKIDWSFFIGDTSIFILLLLLIFCNLSVMSGIAKLIELHKLTWDCYFSFLKEMARLLDVEIDLDEYEDVYKSVR